MRADFEKIVWEAECHPKIRSWKFTLLNLCHHANADGESFPSVGRIVRETGYSAKAVSDALAGLEAMGIVRRSGRCGKRQRVTVYSLAGILTSVHNLSNSEVSSRKEPFNSEVSSRKEPFNSEVSSPNSEVSSPNSEVSSHRNNIGRIEVSKLVSTAVNSEPTSSFVDNPEKHVAPSARNYAVEGGETAKYAQLVRKVGWKPTTDEDRRYCMAYCYQLGASRDEAEKFIRYNARRRWRSCEMGTVNDVAKGWVEQWRERDPEGFIAERQRRRSADMASC